MSESLIQKIMQILPKTNAKLKFQVQLIREVSNINYTQAVAT